MSSTKHCLTHDQMATCLKCFENVEDVVLFVCLLSKLLFYAGIIVYELSSVPMSLPSLLALGI